MKHPALIFIAVICSWSAQAQNSAKQLSETGIKSQKMAAFQTTIIGETTYDLQTNRAIGNRLILHPNNTLSAIWTMIPVNGGSSARGTGYNFFDGTSWGPQPTYRIEKNQRSGFPTIAVTSSGRLLVAGHSSTLGGTLITKSDSIGSGIWYNDTTSFAGNANESFMKIATGGSNGQTIHIIGNGSGTSGTFVAGQNGPLFYSRSLDGGNTFPVLRSIIPAIDSTQYRGFSAENYSIDTKGDTVVIVIGGITTDLIFLKSVDNGNTWNKTILQSFPIPLFDANSDTLPTGGVIVANGDAHIRIDNNGISHVFWSNIRVISDTTGGTLKLGLPFYETDAILYWNETHPIGDIVTIARALDANGDGIINLIHNPTIECKIGFYSTTYTRFPTAAVDSANNLFVSYQSVCENCDTIGYNKMLSHIYTIASQDGGQTWSQPLDIDKDLDSLFHENAYPCLAKKANGAIHIVFQQDYTPGHSLLTGGLCPPPFWNAASSILYTKIDYTGPGGFPWRFGTVGVKSIKSSTIPFQIAPNPSDEYASIQINLKQKSEVLIDVKNSIGATMYTDQLGQFEKGKHALPLQTSSFVKGMYFITIRTNDQVFTGKCLVVHPDK